MNPPQPVCPFCQSTQVSVEHGGADGWFVRCAGCGSTGPRQPDAGAALERWVRVQHSGQLLRTVIDESPDIILLKDWDGRFLLGNKALAQLYRTTPEQLVGKDDGAFNPNSEQVAFYLENVRSIMRSGQTQVVQETSTDAETGEVRYFHSIKKPLRGPLGEHRILVIAHDVTDLQRAHQAIEARERSYTYAMDAAREGIWDWDIPGNRVSHNVKWCELLGFDVSETSHPMDIFTDLLHEDDREATYEALQQALQGSGDYWHEHRMRRRDGRVIWVVDRGRVVERDAEGRPIRMAGSMSDISERKRNEQLLADAREALVRVNCELEQKVAERTLALEQANQELQKLARHDVLTGLPNRLSTNERLDHEFKLLRRSQRPYAILMLDVDNFKSINDTYGHAHGDLVLRRVAEVLRSNLREADFVARHGGEEFLVLLPDSGLEGACMVAEKIRKAMAASPIPKVGRVTLSGGVALAQPTDAGPMVAVQQADAALYQSKQGGRNRMTVAA